LIKFFTQHSALSTQYFDLVYLLLIAAYVLAGTPLAPFHGDEATQISMSRDYAYQFQQRDLDLVRFRDDAPSPGEQYLRLINGSINKYTVGLAWHLAGLSVNDVNEQWDWLANWDYNQTTGHAPSPALLAAARWPSALFLATSVAVVFALGHVMGGRPVAYFASLCYALNPIVLLNGRRAMMEGSMLLFGLLVVLVGLWFLRRPSWTQALLLGLAAGLALAAKHTNLFIVGAVFAACVLYPLVQRIARPTRESAVHFSPARSALLLVFAAFITAFVFYLLNPVWWGGSPIEHTVFILKLRGDLLGGQMAAFGGYAGRLDQLGGMFRQVFVALPQYYEAPGWGEWIADQIARYKSSPFQGVSIGGSLPGALLLLALFVYGVLAFLRDRAAPLSSRWLLILWGLVMLLSTSLLTPLEWQRYYLPAYPAVGLFAAFGLVRLIQLVKSR
jgi:4-amino-4-deoxy-L-arabinose transferase-like glycosyltransferase